MKHLLITIAAVMLVGCGPSVDEFRKAVYDGEIETVKKAIAAGVDVNIRNKNKDTPLHVAASGAAILDYPAKEIIELLIANGADVNAQNHQRRTALHNTSTKEIVELLIANGADVNAKDKSLETSLHFAAINGNKETAELLITKGADVNAKRADGSTPLHSASGEGYKEIAELLIEKGADVNTKFVEGYFAGQTPLDLAIRSENDVADLLRNHSGKSGAEDSFYVATLVGDIEAVKQHLANGEDVNASIGETTPLNVAAFEGHIEIAELLIAKGADLNARNHWNNTPLGSAIRNDLNAMADLLRKHGAKTAEELKAEEK